MEFSQRPGLLVCALAGLQAGIVGVFWMFGCFIVAAYWNGQSIWSIPNLFSTAFYGGNAWESEFARTTWSGLALILALYGLLGAFWGCLDRQSRPFIRALGALAGVATYYLFFGFIWVHLAPPLALYAPTRELLVAHVIWGAALAGAPRYSRRIQQATSGSAGADVTGEWIR